MESSLFFFSFFLPPSSLSLCVNWPFSINQTAILKSRCSLRRQTVRVTAGDEGEEIGGPVRSGRGSPRANSPRQRGPRRRG